MFTFELSQVIRGEAAAVWAVWSDPDRFPEWDPRELRTELRGPFAPGSRIESKQAGNPGGEVTITVVEPESRWTAASGLPGGRLVIDHLIAPAGPGQVTITKRYQVSGPLVILFRLYYAPRVLRALPASFAGLQRAAQQLAAARRADG